MRYYFHLRSGPEEISHCEGIDMEECALKNIDIEKILNEIPLGAVGACRHKGMVDRQSLMRAAAALQLYCSRCRQIDWS